MTVQVTIHATRNKDLDETYDPEEFAPSTGVTPSTGSV